MRIGRYGELPPVTQHILIVNVVIWLATFVPSVAAAIERYAALYYFTSPSFNPAQLLTYMFVQFDFIHLLFNMFTLFFFGIVLERTLGSQRFLFYYVSCGIGAALIQEGAMALMAQQYMSGLTPEMVSMAEAGRYLPTEPMTLKLAILLNTPCVGASGCVYGLLLAFGMLFPNQRIYLYAVVPMKAKWFVLIFAAIELLLGISNLPGDNVAHFAHLGGALFGLFILLYWRNKGLFRDGVY